jgi:hypothetical protein
LFSYLDISRNPFKGISDEFMKSIEKHLPFLKHLILNGYWTYIALRKLKMGWIIIIIIIIIILSVCLFLSWIIGPVVLKKLIGMVAVFLFHITRVFNTEILFMEWTDNNRSWSPNTRMYQRVGNERMPIFLPQSKCYWIAIKSSLNFIEFRYHWVVY